jgi:hypothetical protein
MALRIRCRRLIFGGVLDQLNHRDRLTGIVLDLPDIERGGVAVEGRVTAQRGAIEYALQLLRCGNHCVAQRRGQLSKALAVVPIHGEVDAKTLLGALDEFLAKGDADIGVGDALAVAHDRRHGENAERIPARFDADNRPAGPVRFHHRGAAAGGVVAECLGVVDPVESHCRRGLERDQRDTLRLQRLHGVAEQRPQRITVAFGDGVTHRRQ